MTEKKIYQKTKVVVGQQHFNESTKLYSGKVETNFYGTKEFTLRVHETPIVKEWDWGKGVIVAEISLGNKTAGIRERESQYGKQYAGTLVAGEFFVNLDQVLARGDIPSYEVTFVEKDIDAMKGTTIEEDDDKPF